MDSVRTEAAGFAPVVDVEVVQVAATVSDDKGRLVKGLGRDAFRVFEDGREQEVTHFIGADAERELVVAVDMSGSMGPAMARCREAVKRFLASIRPVDAVTVLAFNDSVFTVSRREATPEARLRAVDRLRSWGSTAFYDAVLRGLDLLERHRGRRALVLFTDGEDMVSHATAQDVQRRIEVSASPVYVVAQGKGMREPGLKRVLDRVAGVSGGRAFYTDSVDELDGVFAEIGEDIASQYLLAYAPAEVRPRRQLAHDPGRGGGNEARGPGAAGLPRDGSGEVMMRVWIAVAALLAASLPAAAQPPEAATQPPEAVAQQPAAGRSRRSSASAWTWWRSTPASWTRTAGRCSAWGPRTSGSRWTASPAASLSVEYVGRDLEPPRRRRRPPRALQQQRGRAAGPARPAAGRPRQHRPGRRAARC